MLRRLLVFLASLCTPLAALAMPAGSAEAYGATVHIWYDLGSWPCSSGCTGGYQTGYDWLKVGTTGISGGPDFLTETWSDPGSYYSVYTTNCAIDSVYAYVTAPPGSGANTGTIELSMNRYGNMLIGSATFVSDRGVGSGTYSLAVPVTGTTNVDTTNACLAGPHTVASWSGTGTLTLAHV